MEDLTIQEKLNCKDYQGATRVVDYWNKEDKDLVSEIHEVGVTYVWRVGTVRFRVVRRAASWEELIYPDQHKYWLENRK